jgi:signal-transduction protein with cAMP-binding, CBS, and nucleotidyltransferase domain
MFLTGLLLRQQLEDHRQGRPPGVYVAPQALSQRDRKRLKDALQAVARLRGMVHMEFSGELF